MSVEGPHFATCDSAFQPLNRFQRAMGRWERIHPYNAGHLVRVRGPLLVERLRVSILRQCRTCGVEALVLNRRCSGYRYHPLESISLEFLDPPEGGRREREHLLERELNRPFPVEPHHPLRWFAGREDDDSWTLAVVYHHLASDAHGVMVLLARVLRDYFGDAFADDARPLTTRANPFRLNRASMTESFGPLRSFTTTARSYFALRCAHRLHERRDGGESTSVVTREAPIGFAPALASRCKQAGAGVNDAFLAAMAVALSERTPRRRAHRRRRKIALASAVSLRAWARDDLAGSFGTYVGHAILLVDDPDAEFERVLADVARQTALHKRQRRAAGIAWPLVFARYLWPLFGIPDATASYRKLYPLCAGVSSVRIDESVFGEAAARLIDYERICPPGPAMPMVLAPTTYRDRLCLSLVFRDAALSRDDAMQLMDRVFDVLARFVGMEAATAAVSSLKAGMALNPSRTVETVPARDR